MVKDCTATSTGQGAFDACMINAEKFMGDVVCSSDILTAIRKWFGKRITPNCRDYLFLTNQSGSTEFNFPLSAQIVNKNQLGFYVLIAPRSGIEPVIDH
jgi:hypothetical protein